MRVGIGYDVHKLVEGRKLILGGVEIPHILGLLGHSDADVLIHAVMDALLGAAALGDIGKHFPDSDEKFKDINSRKLLRETGEIIAAKGYCVGNVDCTICAESPKLLPYIEQMQQNISNDLRIDINCVNVKATTTEGLGFVGRGEGISVYAVGLLKE